MWVDQKVLKLLALVFEYTTELYKTYTEYKANISRFCSDVLMTQYTRRNMTTLFDDAMQQWPGEKNDEHFAYQASYNDKYLFIVKRVLFLD